MAASAGPEIERLISLLAKLPGMGPRSARRAALALLNLGGENTRSAARAETRTLGGIVAENLAVEAMTAQPAPAPGDSDGTEALAGRDWRWTRAVTATDDPDILRIDIRVSDDEGQASERVLFRAVGS